MLAKQVEELAYEAKLTQSNLLQEKAARTQVYDDMLDRMTQSLILGCLESEV